MKIKVLPKTSFGKKAMILFVLFIALMIASNVASLSQTEADGITTMDSVMRPVIIVTGLFGMLSGLSGFVLSILAMAKQKERAILVALPLLLGLGLLFLLVGELFVPH